MSFIKAFQKLALRSGNNAIYNRDKRNAVTKAYEKTGEEMRKARKHGYYINGSATYKRNYNAATTKAKQRYETREKFINDL